MNEKTATQEPRIKHRDSLIKIVLSVISLILTSGFVFLLHIRL
jgi:hypothetical protein